MTTIINDRDVLLQATVPRNNAPALGKAFILSADTPVFHVNLSGVSTPTIINLSTQRIAINSTVSWGVVGATGLTISGDTYSATLAYSSMTASTATVTAQTTYLGVTYTQTQIVNKVLDGANGANGANGTNGTNGSNGVRGTVTLVGTGYSSWSDAGAAAVISANGSGSPVNGDIVTLTNGTSFTMTKFYSFGTWYVLTAYIDGNLLVSGTIQASAINAGTFTGQTYQTAPSGARTVINASSNNQIITYNSSGTVISQIGGIGYGASSAYFSSSSGLYPCLYATMSGSNPAVTAEHTGGSLGAGLAASSSSSSGLGALISNSGGGTALGVSGLATLNATRPTSNNTYDLGTSSIAWKGIYSVTALNVTSDRRTKTDIEDSPLGLAAVLQLRPRRYRLKVGRYDEVVTVLPEPEGPKLPGWQPEREVSYAPVPGQRWHFGLIADEAEAVIGLENGVVCLADKEDPDSMRSIRYEEILPIALQAIKDLASQVASLEARIAALEPK